MSKRPRLMPKNPVLLQTQVVESRRLSPSFQRVTVAGSDLQQFDYLGYDHWFRMFIPQHPGAGCEMPGVGGGKWWKTYLALDEAERPHCANYTVSDVRDTEGGRELDIDVVLHWDAEGELAGSVAIWAANVEVGTPVAILDQGLIFDPGLLQQSVVIVCDETGLPAARGILRKLPEDATGVAVIEVPDAADEVALDAPAGMDVHWVPRSGGAGGAGAADSAGNTDGAVDIAVGGTLSVGGGEVNSAHGKPGLLALAKLEQLDVPVDNTYAYAVGESGLATGARRLLHSRGIAKRDITFSGYWKAD